ncbi:MAG: hypothetical protein MJB14_21075 [Spirochaetes bacterium]|nr:hypothetical protein [Spirochaetota bacterium]
MQLYEKMGFQNNPFSTFSAEEEIDFLASIYYYPLFFESLKNDLIEGHSRFIIGKRGCGKTALLFSLKEKLAEQNVFSILIDNYYHLPLKQNKIEFLNLILTELIISISINIFQNPAQIKKLTKYQKEKLAIIIKLFFKTLSKQEFEDYYHKVTHFKSKNLLKKIYNNIFNRPLNLAVSGGIEIISDTIRKSLGLPEINQTIYYKNYLPQLNVEEISISESEKRIKQDLEALTRLLKDFSEIIQSMDYLSIVIFFDKIDEFTELNSNITLINQFILDLLKDTNLLMIKGLSFSFSIWDAVKTELSRSGVRFDKIKPLDITWSKEHLKEILARRIAHFSQEKIRIEDIITSSPMLDKILYIATHSPRFLFRILSIIYDIQSVDPTDTTHFTENAIRKGLLDFCLYFDFYTMWPGKAGKKNNILQNVNRLLKIGKLQFTTKDYIKKFKVSTYKAIAYIKVLKNYGLIKDSSELDNERKIYQIDYPVIEYLIDNDITELDY